MEHLSKGPPRVTARNRLPSYRAVSYFARRRGYPCTLPTIPAGRRRLTELTPDGRGAHEGMVWEARNGRRTNLPACTVSAVRLPGGAARQGVYNFPLGAMPIVFPECRC